MIEGETPALAPLATRREWLGLAIGAAAFGVASISAAFSTSAGMLIATRALLGVAGATLMPSTLSLIRCMFHDARERTLAIGVNTIALFVWMGSSLFAAQYLQLVLEMTPLDAGLWTMPAASASVVGCMLAPMFARRARPGVVIAAGLGLAALGFALLSYVPRASGLGVFATATVLISLGVAVVVTASTDVLVASAPPERAGVASAISESGTELGGALGIAILGSIGAAAYRAAMMRGGAHDGLSADAIDDARETLGRAIVVAEALPAPLGPELLLSARAAFAEAFTLTAAISAAVMLIAAALAAFLLRGVTTTNALRGAGGRQS